MKDLFSRTANVARTFGAATLLATSSVANSDEALIPPGTTLGQFPSTSIPTLQNTFANQIVSDITPDPALVPSNTFRWLLVKTDSGLALTLPDNYAGAIQHFGQQEKFFVRFDTNTGLPEISFDLQNWRPYTAGTPVAISREERATIVDISNNLQVLNTLQTQQTALSTTLAEQQAELAQIQAEITTLQTDLVLTDYALALTESDISQQESTKNTLETTMKPKAKLRTDTHLIALNTSIDDVTKTNLTQSALNTYDTSTSLAQMPAPSPRSPKSNFVPPTLSDVQATITLLTNELSRIQTQIDSVNSQITTKQNEITATENSIAEIQKTINILSTQINEYKSAFYYWDDEWKRLDALVDDIIADLGIARQGFDNAVYTLKNEGGRNDVPDNVDDPNIAAQVDALKKRISLESVNIANTVPANSWGTDTSTKGKSTYTSTTYVRVGGEYYYKVYYSTTGGYPATIKMYLKPVGGDSYGLATKTYTAQNYTHRMAIVNQTVLPFNNMSCDYALADRKLETCQEQYVQLEIDRDNTRDERGYADKQRDAAQLDLHDANELAIQRNAEKDTLTTQKSDLTTQKSDLEALKNTKAQLQTLYTRVKTIIDQLKQHVSSYSAITQEIANLLTEAQTLEDEIIVLESWIASAEGDEQDLHNKVASTSGNLTTTNTALIQNEQQLLALLSTLSTIIPQDSFSRDGTVLTPSSEALRYFADKFRTGTNARILAGLPVTWMIQYYHDGNNDLSTNIYPASLSVQYKLGGRVYMTDGQTINNFAHKEFTNGHLEEVITKLNTCIALLNQYPAESSDGIGIFLSELLTQISQLAPYHGTDTTIRNYVATKNTFTKKTLLQGGSYALFEHMLAHNAAFSLKIEQITDIATQKGNIPSSADALNDLRHMMTTIMARSFTEKLMFSGTEGLNSIYANWEQEALSFINGLGDTATLTNQLDMNAEWSVDVHGNKYKFGLYHPAGIGNYTVSATLFMMYSPDGSNTQVLGPVQVASGAEADAMKARWQQELLKMKRIHASYKGGTYDIFKGTSPDGGEIWWGQAIKNGIQKSTTFSENMKIVEGSVKAFLVSTNISSNLSSNEAFYRSLFGLPYDYFAQNAQASLSSLLQFSDQNLSLALGQILDYSINVSAWSGHQKEVAKVIVSLSGVSGFPADQVKEFQRKAIQQLDTLGTNYEQDIINDTLIAGRDGNIEEIRTVVVLQKLSQLFMKKKLEMNAMNDTSKLNTATQLALGVYGISLAGHQIGMKRLYFATEESAGESNLKRNLDFVKLCSGDTTLDPGGRVMFLNKRIDLSTMGNILLGYNAKQLGLTLEETVFGAFVAQGAIETGKSIKQIYENWDTSLTGLKGTLESLGNIHVETTVGEDEDRINYTKGYSLENLSPSSLLKL